MPLRRSDHVNRREDSASARDRSPFTALRHAIKCEQREGPPQSGNGNGDDGDDGGSGAIDADPTVDGDFGGALAYYNTIPVNPAGRYVLFATDGLPNCLNGDPNTESGAATVAAVTALKNAGIKTYVLGFGEFGGGDILNDAAIAGGVPQAGATKYYQVNNQAQLDAALQAISGGIIVPSCSFALQSIPPDPNNVTVTLNGTPVPRSPSHANGWDYSPNAMTITFFGSYCTQISMGAMTNVSFVYGCPGPVIN